MSATNGEADSKNLVRITDDPSDDEDPAWGAGGKGVDLSRYSLDVVDTSWKDMVSKGTQFAIVQAWNGGSQSACAQDQLVGDGNLPDSCNEQVPMNTTGAQNNGLSTGAYVVLNYFPNGGTGINQVDQGIAAVGFGITNLTLMVVDVETFQGEVFETASKWHPSTKYKVGAQITDNTKAHVQIVITAGTSGPGPDPPAWNDAGGTTPDGTGTLMWRDEGLPNVLAAPGRVNRICEAVAEIQAQCDAQRRCLNAAIYTDRANCGEITKNKADGKSCPAPNSGIILTNLPLWDTEHKTGGFKGPDLLKHCGDGFPGLRWQGTEKPYSSLGWQNRSGNQYDYGFYAPPPPQKPCDGNALFGIAANDVDLDYFDAALFTRTFK